MAKSLEDHAHRAIQSKLDGFVRRDRMMVDARPWTPAFAGATRKAGGLLIAGPSSPPPVGRQRGIERQQGEVRRTIGAVEAEGPAEGSGDREEPLAMMPEPLGISFADPLDPPDHSRAPLPEPSKAHAPA